MIFYGLNASHLRTAPLPDATCPNCATTDTLHGSVSGRYAHIYWVPFVPIGKPTVLHCAQCEQTWEGKAVPTEMRQPLLAIKKATPAPWWHWSGLALLILGVSGGLMASSFDDRRDEGYLTAPKAGDVYTIHADAKADNYSLLKVVSAKGNTVSVVNNQYEIDNRHPLDDLNFPDKYEKEPYSLTLLELKIMRNNHQIVDVERLGE